MTATVSFTATLARGWSTGKVDVIALVDGLSPAQITLSSVTNHGDTPELELDATEEEYLKELAIDEYRNA